MSEPQVFEFECNSKKHRIRFDGPGEPMIFETKSDTGNWGRVYRDGSCRAVGIRALLARDAHRDECWRELMDTAKAMRDELGARGYQTVAFDDVFDALQAKWERGGK